MGDAEGLGAGRGMRVCSGGFTCLGTGLPVEGRQLGNQEKLGSPHGGRQSLGPTQLSFHLNPNPIPSKLTLNPQSKPST